VILPLDKRPVIVAKAGSNGAGKTWQNKSGQQYGIQGISTMWLVDRKGDVAAFDMPLKTWHDELHEIRPQCGGSEAGTRRRLHLD